MVCWWHTVRYCLKWWAIVRWIVAVRICVYGVSVSTSWKSKFAMKSPKIGVKKGIWTLELVMCLDIYLFYNFFQIVEISNYLNSNAADPNKIPVNFPNKETFVGGPDYLKNGIRSPYRCRDFGGTNNSYHRCHLRLRRDLRGRDWLALNLVTREKIHYLILIDWKSIS